MKTHAKHKNSIFNNKYETKLLIKHKFQLLFSILHLTTKTLKSEGTQNCSSN